MKKVFSIIIMVVAFIGITLTSIDSMFISNTNHPLLEGVKLYRYFTIQSNFIVGIYFGILSFSRLKDNKTFDKLLGGVMIYITITFLVYMIILDPIYDPQGLNLIGSIISHYITPILVIIFVGYYRNDYLYELNDIKKWIIYPLVYLLFLFIYGLFTGDYIYPFFQVSKIGIIGVLLVSVCMVLFFLIMSFLTVKILSKNKNAN